MYDTNQHLANKELVENLRGGAYPSARLDVSTKSTNTQRAKNAIGCIIVSILALHASAYQRDVTSVGFVLISLISAIYTLYSGVLMYKEPVSADTPTTTTDGLFLTLFLLANACILLFLGTRSVVALVY